MPEKIFSTGAPVISLLLTIIMIMFDFLYYNVMFGMDQYGEYLKSVIFGILIFIILIIIMYSPRFGGERFYHTITNSPFTILFIVGVLSLFSYVMFSLPQSNNDKSGTYFFRGLYFSLSNLLSVISTIIIIAIASTIMNIDLKKFTKSQLKGVHDTSFATTMRSTLRNTRRSTKRSTRRSTGRSTGRNSGRTTRKWKITSFWPLTRYQTSSGPRLLQQPYN